MRPPESLPSLLLFLLATIPSPQCVAATGSSNNNNIKDLVDAVVHPLNPRTLSQIIWPRLADPPGGPPPPPPPPDMLPDPATLDAVVGSQNLQGFNEALGGIAAGPITESDDLQRRYKANGNTFPTFIEAAQRTCEVQANDCTTAANTPQQNNNNNDNQKPDPNPSNNGTPSQQAQKIELTIDKCEAQRTRCLSFQSKSASVTTFPDQSSTSTTTSSTTAPPTVNATTTTTTTTAAASTSTLSLVTTTNTTTTTAPPPLPPGAGPTGTQLINLGPDPQFPMFDLLCDV